jgi:predicted TIM-barrel fold metal-dependent hydrolase
MATVVDASINLRGHLKLPFYKSEVRRAARERGATVWTTETLLAELDAAGIDKAVLLSSVAAVGVGGEIDAIHPDEVQALVEKAPDRLYGMVGINPLTTMPTLRLIEYAIKELGFKGVHVYPHWFGVRVNEPLYYPIYAKCAELGVPIAMQVGSQTPRNHAKLAAKPEWLDQVAFDFPELNILGLHIGSPWVDEMIMLCRNYENVYIVADAHEPRLWEPSLIEYLNGGGRRNLDGIQKVIWGTDWPIQEWQQSLAEVRDLPISDEARDNLLGLNAIRVLNLD